MLKGPRYRLLPVRTVDGPSHVLLKRGRAEVLIEGAGAPEAVRAILDAARRGATREEICARFAAPDRPVVGEVVDGLVKRRFLVPVDGEAPPEAAETSLDVFYWHLDATTGAVNERLASREVVLVGVNAITRRLAEGLREAGATRVAVLDDPLLRDPRFFDADGRVGPAWGDSSPAPADPDAWLRAPDADATHCVVASSDVGARFALRPWNEACIRARVPFLPILLDDLIGTLGPLVVPGETACFECLRARQNAIRREGAARLPEPEGPEALAPAGHHPAMSAILADIAVMEIAKWRGGLPESRAGRLIEVNLLATRMQSRRVLKIPRCRVCSPLLVRGEVADRKEAIALGPGLRYSGSYGE